MKKKPSQLLTNSLIPVKSETLSTQGSDKVND